MPVETADDRSYLLADFGVSATYTSVGGTPATITVIFDNEYIPVETGATMPFAMQQPKCLARTSDLAGVAENGTLAIDGTTYYIRIVMPDGTGMTELMLERQ
jgi:hypothetical protein